MIASFEKKLEQVKDKRKQEWKPVRNLQNEIGQLKKQASELDDFLAEMGIDLRDQKNAYEKNMEEKQKKVKTYSIHGTEIIDNALNVLVANQACKKNLLGELSIFLNSKKKSSMHYDAAMVLAALSEREMKKCTSYNESLVYKEYMEKAFGVLVQQADADVYYAQWGKNIYDICLPKLVKEGDRTTAVQECKDAYEKFGKMTSSVTEVELYAGYRPGDEVSEVELLFLRNQKKYTKPKGVIRNLIDTSTDSNRGIIKMYRYEILEKAMMQLGNTGDSLNDLKDEIIACGGTFQGDVKKLFEKYNVAYLGAKNEKNKNYAIDYITERRYLNVFSEEYKRITKTRYEDDLKNNLLKAVNELLVDYVLDDVWFHEITKEYVEKRKTTFDNWAEKDIKAACVTNYRSQVETRIGQIKVVPVYAQRQYLKIAEFKQRLRGFATDKDIIRAVEEEAWKNRWYNKVPKGEFEKYYSKAEEVLKQEIKEADKKAKRSAEERAKKYASQHPTPSKPVQTSTTSQQTSTLEPQSTSKANSTKSEESKGLLKKFGNWCMNNTYEAFLIISLTVGVIIGFVFMSVESLSERAIAEQEAKANYTEDDLATDIINNIINTTAELSETATPATEFSYEEVSYFPEPCIYITKYNGVAETVEVPAVIDGMNVCGIAREAFVDNIYLKKVILPDTIVSLDYRAFANCALLEEVVCSSNLTNIYDNVFEGCSSLTSFVCKGDESSLRAIGKNAFVGCTSLKTVDIQTDVYTSFTLADACFYECQNLESINLNGEKLESVILGESAFNTCISLTAIPFADKITEMGRWPFANCTSLASIDLPNVTYIDRASFENCISLTSFHVSSTVKGIDPDAFKGCTSLATVTFDAVELTAEEEGYGIGDAAFYGTAITEIEIPSQYKSIGKYTFSACPNLTKFVWHNSGKNVLTQTMGEHCFVESYNLKEVYLPRTISTMGWWDINCMGTVTIYAMEGSVPHTFATENGYAWAAWTE